ncbi:hypothetical protein AMS68_005098 [Peltaster fructicola]|uniref:SH3 domain-containing protein n=1 Tax=Peltaster fructicola TaxID=286661 RepID=A0A6H0XY37_9PEZI|nr:hypothetical protein AMS68_005098 [Peltaster fructicola]
MADVLPPHLGPYSPSSHTSPPEQPDPLSATSEPGARPRPRSHISRSNSRRSARLSTLSRHTSFSRPQSVLYPAFPSTLSYAAVRDFAYPVFHPLHYGTPLEPPSGATTPGSEWASSRRLSDPLEAWNSKNGNWGAGPWGGDGVMYTDPSGDDGEALPSTSFGEDTDEPGGSFVRRKSKHRKSRSYTDITELERGRWHDSSSFNRRSRGDADTYGSKLDPAGQSSLRLSRNFGSSSSKRSTNTLPSRSFHTGQLPEPENDEDLLPLDAEQSAHAQSPQRASMGPEDEELFAGESLALYSFEPENPNELRLREGQIILVSYRHGQGWLVAEDPETGEQGLVPEEYVRLVREIETWDPERGGFIEDDSMLVDEQSEQHDSNDHMDLDEPHEMESDTSQDISGTSEKHMLQTDLHEKATDLLDSRQDSAHGESRP